MFERLVSHTNELLSVVSSTADGLTSVLSSDDYLVGHPYVDIHIYVGKYRYICMQGVLY